MMDCAGKDRLMEQAKAARQRRKEPFEGLNSTAGEQRSVCHHDGLDWEGYRRLLDNVPCAAYSAFPDKTGRTTFISKKWQEWTGFSCEQLYQDSNAWPKCIYPDDKEDAVEAYAAACRDAVSYNLEYRLIHKDTGQVRHVKDQGFLSKNEDGSIMRVDGIITDVTDLIEAGNELKDYQDNLEKLVEQRAAELSKTCDTLKREEAERRKALEALRQSESKFRTIFETAANLITSVNNEGILVECNSRMKEVLGYEKGEVIGQSMARIIHPDHIEKVQSFLKEVVSAGFARNKEYKMVRKDGSEIDVSVNSTALKDENGKFVRTLCIIDDITERKQAELRVLEDREQLKSLASQLSITEERERHRLATELHDQIGQSLVFSKFKLDLLRKSASSQEFVEALEDVCNSLGQVIDDTRTLTFDLSSPILYELGLEAAIAEWLKDEIRDKHGIETEFEDDRQPKPLDDDIRTVLFRNVRELLVNIVKHAQAHKVKVCVRRAARNVRISVEDDGVGFDPVDVTSRAAKRAEFGLFSIRQRLEQLGGVIEIASAPGRGCRISMTAPLKRDKDGGDSHN